MGELPGRELPGCDRPGGAVLLALAREVLLRDLAPLLPAERRLDALMVASSMSIAEREMAEDGSQRAIAEELRQFYRKESAGEPPLGGRVGDDTELLRRFADDLRRGAFEAAPEHEHERAARAILWRSTLARLRLANPRFLDANGLG